MHVSDDPLYTVYVISEELRAVSYLRLFGPRIFSLRSGVLFRVPRWRLTATRYLASLKDHMIAASRIFNSIAIFCF